MTYNKIYTAESVSLGHPDALTDFIANAILDAYLAKDPHARVAIDGIFKGRFLTLGGEITSKVEVNILEIVNLCLEKVGYPDALELVTTYFDQQSPDIALGTNDKVKGAGDQGTITGYACTGNPLFMPLEKALADELMRELYFTTRQQYPWLGPDMKAQVTLHYESSDVASPISSRENNDLDSSRSGDNSKVRLLNPKPVIDTIIIAAQHTEKITRREITRVVEHAIHDVMKRFAISHEHYKNAEIIINGTGKFTIGGPAADSGEVGRKVVVDAYGVRIPVGGGTFNGKDATKVDRSAAYMARFAAKSIVAAGLADECLVTVSYCIGKVEPVSVNYDFFGTAKIPEAKIIEAATQEFSFRPSEMIRRLNLRQPIFATAGQICHFGKTVKTSILTGEKIAIPWENVAEAVENLKSVTNC